jgi:TolB-like protein/Tfp pilus assembly protein PilF
MTSEQWLHIKTIVQQSLETEPGKRARFVAEKCGDDVSLRDEVGELLAINESIGDFIETPAYLQVAETLPIAESAPELAPGQVLGHYEVIRELGRGGMGTVYLAQDNELGRKVALKILPSGFSDRPAAADRFRREARVVSALNHPNILTIHEIGQFDSIDFITTEFVDGVTLRDRIARSPMQPSEAIEISVQVAAALAEAHAAGIIHRDIKPENVMIRRNGLVKVLDFGIAKLADTQDAVTGIATWSEIKGSLPIGTPKYMSPEQLRGQPVDTRSDLWSFGVVLYEALTGHVPDGDVDDDLERGRSGEERSELLKDLHQVIRRCLERDAASRYQSAQEVLDDLRGLQRAVHDGEANDTTPRMSAQRYASFAVLILLATMAAAFVYVLFFRGLAPAIPEIKNLAVLPLETVGANTQTEDYFADGFTEELINQLSQIGALRVIARTSMMRYKTRQQSLPQIAQELNVDAVVQATIQRTGGLIRLSAKLIHAPSGRQLWERSYERPERDILAVQQEVTRDIASGISIKLTPQEQDRLLSSRPVDPEAHEEYLKGRFYLNNRNEQAIKTAITHFDAAIAKDPDFALPHAFLADAYFALGTQMIAALPPAEALTRGEAAALKAVELDGTLAEAHTALAVIRLYSWQWEQAEQGFKRALELNPNYGVAHSWYALYFVSQGRVGEAIARMYRARDLDPLSPHMNQNVGWMLHYARQFDEEIVQYNRALELDPNFLFARRRLAEAYSAKGMHGEAIAENEKVIALMDRSPTSLGALGSVYALAGRKAEARMILDELLEMKKRQFVSASIFANLYNDLGERKTAFEYLEKAYRERSYAMVFLKVTTDFDEAFRKDPRFLDVLRRLGV